MTVEAAPEDEMDEANGMYADLEVQATQSGSERDGSTGGMQDLDPL